MSGKPRVLIFVLAYDVESTLRATLDRIPREVFDAYECEVLVVDDGSADGTFVIGETYRRGHPRFPLTILRNTYNQGYGGNQKMGYSYAIREGFEVVVMLHGDGQYAPEELLRMLAPVVDDEADAVFGSRMMSATGALEGGMPLYKYVGNRILTTAQNLLLGSELSEFHSGYRAYRVDALSRINFLLDSNDFHFDTEIIIQLLNADMRIREIEIPTFYGDEVSHVEGLRYAKDVMLATAKNVLHRVGLVYQRRFDPDEHQRNDELKLGYASSHQLAIDAVPEGAKVIDLGAGPGVAQELVKKGCDVTVLHRATDAEPAKGVEVILHDLDDPLDVDIGEHTHLLLLDIIEHLESPERFLEGLREQFTFDHKTILLTTPNIAFGITRLTLLAGQFNYSKRGVLDLTHTRLFTFRSLKQLLDDAGIVVKEVRGIPAPFPKALGNNTLSRAALKLNEALIRLSPGLFSYQILVVAESRPSIDFILEEAAKESARAARELDESVREPA